MPNSFTTTTASGSSNVAGRYCSKSDIDAVYGSENVTRWSQLDNALTTADSAVILRAIQNAESQIDDFFRESSYAVPLVVNSGTTVRDWSARLAGVLLYRARGNGDDADRYDGIVAELWSVMAQYRGGALRLDAAPHRSYQPTCPVMIL